MAGTTTPRSISDQDYLKNEQYRTDSNLQARITLHRKYGTNPGSWFRWVFDHLPLSAGSVVLEVGCGPGDLWYENRDRFPENFRLLLGDLSSGMVRAARSKNAATPGIRYLTVDAQHIPLPTSSCDCVVANHMLYHIPDMDMALLEIRRVMKPGGLLCAATNGINHIHQVHEIIEMFKPQYSRPLTGIGRFALENGPELLKQHFSYVRTDLFEDNLQVTDPKDLMAYIASMWHTGDQVDRQVFNELSVYVEQIIRNEGHFFIEKSQGVIMAQYESGLS